MKHVALLSLVLAIAACKKKEEAPPPPPVTIDAADMAATVDAAEPVDAAEAADAAHTMGNVMPDIWFTDQCPKVVAKIGECAKDKAFAETLTKDVDKKAVKGIQANIKAAGAWAAPDKAKAACENIPKVKYETQGFLEKDWSALAADDVLADCAKLATAIKDNGGLFGGKTTPAAAGGAAPAGGDKAPAPAGGDKAPAPAGGEKPPK